MGDSTEHGVLHGTSWAVPNDENMTELKVAELVGFGKGETTDSKGLKRYAFVLKGDVDVMLRPAGLAIPNGEN